MQPGSANPDTGDAKPSALWYFDFISPFAYLQLPKVLALRERLEILPTPIVFGAVLKHHGQLGPAEIPGKREFTYRFVQWTADRRGVALRFPPAHPFNSLAALRLCLAAGGGWTAVGAIFDHLWRDGHAGTAAADLADLGRRLGVADVASAIAADAVKSTLRTNTERALARGVFGVPTLDVGGDLFWGDDASAMVEDWLDDRARFASGEYARIASLPGVQRTR